MLFVAEVTVTVPMVGAVLSILKGIAVVVDVNP